MLVGLTLLIDAATLLVQGILILVRPGDLFRRVTFALMAIMGVIWAVGLAVFLAVDGSFDASYVVIMYYVGAGGLIYAMLLFAISFLTAKRATLLRLSLLLLIPTLLGTIALLIQPSLLINQIHYGDPNVVDLNYTNYLWYGVYFVTYAIAAFAVLIASIIRVKVHIEKRRRQYILAAYLFSLALGATFNLFLPWIGNYRLIWVGPFGMVVFSVFLYIVMIKYRLFTMKAISRQIIIWALSLAVSALAFVAVIDLIYDQLDKTIEIPFSVVFANGVAFVIFAMLFYLLIRFMMRTADRVVDVRLYSTSLVNRVSRIIIKGGDIKNSLHKVAQTIIASSRTQFASFYIDHDDSWSKISSGKAVLSLHQSQLDAIKQAINNNSTPVIVTEEIPNDADLYQLLYSKNIAAVVRLGFETEQRHRHTIGYILIGHNEPMLFSDKEIKALSTIGNLVAVSINNAELFQEIQTFNDELTEKVNDATAKLRHTNAQLKKLDAAKDDFISMASHQLRTPLTTVRGYLSMLMDGDFGRLDAAQRKAISNAYVGSERMAFLISDLLDVSRLQAGHFELSKTWFNLAEVVEAEIDQLRELARTHNIHLEATFAPDLPPIYGDRDKLRQVMMNLIDNAIYYSPDGGNVEVSLYARSGHVVFVVRDYGIGVPKDEQMKLFTKFFRASNARRVRPDGTGIGLYVARKVVVAHHGAIIFDSHENQGSTFGFRLPITPDEPTAANSSPNRPPPGQ